MNCTTTWRRFIRMLPVPALALAMTWLACACASAQDYDELPLYQLNGKPLQSWPQLNGTALDEKTRSILGMLGGDAMDTATFDQYFNDLVFPMFAQWKDVKVGSKTVSPLSDGINGVTPPVLRSKFKSTFAIKATSAAAHDHLNELTLNKMDQIASGNFHPVVRANAIYMIVDLNESDTDPTPKPWKKALPILWKYATAKDTIDAVRIPGWHGLLRFAQSPDSIDAEHKTAVIGAAVDALQRRNDLAGSTQDAKDWICRRAIDVLVALNGPAPNAAISAALLATINDNATSVTIRASAAAALAKIKFVPPANFNPADLAKSLGKLAIDAYKHELETAATHHEPIVVERLSQQLGEIRQALVGPDGNSGIRALFTAGDFQKYVDSLIGPLDNLVAACNNTQALPAPTPTQPPSGGPPVVIPIDRQKPIADAIEAAGSNLEAAVAGNGAAPAAGPLGTAEKSAPGGNPLTGG